MHLNEYEIVTKQEDNSFFKKEVEIDDDTFFMWKMELKKELSTFWEKMGGIS